MTTSIANRKQLAGTKRPPLAVWAVMVGCCLQLGVGDAFAQDAPSAETKTKTEPEADASTAPAPPSTVKISDLPNDAGDGLKVEWQLSPDDQADAQPRRIIRYELFRKREGDEEFQLVGEVTYQTNSYNDDGCELGERYAYRVVAIANDGSKSDSAESAGSVAPVMQWFDTSRGWFGILLLMVSGSVVIFIQMARGGIQLKLRRIAGLEAVSEAVGRATEMGRSCLFVPGIQDINDIQTVAGITILSRVAKLTAEYDAALEVPTARSLVMTTAQETVHASYLAAGRPDAYNAENIYYLTDEQFGYVAGVMGSMVREKPAACFYMGAFYAESLILAETGNSIGAIQVAGTAMPAQLPFFVAACDYTLIGEEFFAASAYLSGEPLQLGSLKGQDVGKLIGAALLIIGCGLATVLQFTESERIADVIAYIQDNVLGMKGFTE